MARTPSWSAAHDENWRGPGWCRLRLRYPVACGDLTLHLDIAFPEHRFGIECDGFATHGSHRRGAFERDRDRWSMLQDAGWRLTWLTWHRLHADPEDFLDEVRRALA